MPSSPGWLYRAALVAAPLSLLLLIGLDAQEPTETTRILMFTPTTEGNIYWPQVYTILEQAADDLGIELIPHEFDITDRLAESTEAAAILETTPDVDGAILSVSAGQAYPLVQAADRRGVPVIIQGPLFETDLRLLGGEPRGRYPNWIATFEQEEEQKGYLLGRMLLDLASEQRTTGDRTTSELGVAGIGGDPSWYGTEERERGLMRAVREHPEARLLQVVPTRWTEEEGVDAARRLLRRYQNVSVIWAASDQLALGASEAAEESGVVVGEDLWIGGLDLSRAGLAAVEEGTISATASATLFSYAEILVYLYDYIHGVDFADEVGTELTFDIHAADAGNADRYITLYASLSEIDFSRFSKAHRTDLGVYDFSTEALEAAIE